MGRPAHDLETLLGEPAYVALAEAFGGTRLYVPGTIAADHPIALAIGLAKAKVLSGRLAPDSITVPLARELRARHYHAAGITVADIARRLGMGERGVYKMLGRVRSRGELPERPKPLPLFPEI